MRPRSDAVLFDPARHEPLDAAPWDEVRVRAAIATIVRDTVAGYRPGRWWPAHPDDIGPGDDPAQPFTPLYFGAAGVIWALRHLRAVGAAPDVALPAFDLEALRDANRTWLLAGDGAEFGSYLMGDLGIELIAWPDDPSPARADRLRALIAGLADHPARELMWGAPGGLLAASFLHEQTGDPRWAGLARHLADRLEAQLQWSDAFGCAYWTQDLYGRHSTYLDAVHGFAATAHGLTRCRHLLEPAAWGRWQARIAQTIERTATVEGGLANWRCELFEPDGRPPRRLMQFCHGAPGFVICLAGFPGPALDSLLLAAGEAVWVAGPLAKGAYLCHGTAGNGYAFLALYRRSGDPRWLQRARAFAMHAIGQANADADRFGRRRHSLWTGDPGLACWLWDCLNAQAGFPTLDRFYPL
jgi:hypothetical protein